MPPAKPLAARAPVRIDLGGGWTDVPPYPERDGGFVCNVAITRFAEVRLAPAREGDASRDALAAAALRRAGVRELAAEIRSDFPVGSGLGGSSAAGVALQCVLASACGESVDAETLVQRSRAVEIEELGIAGGWQDHYAAAYGGALALHFGETTRVERIPLSAHVRSEFARRCLLFYTGETRISGANITAVLDAYGSREPRVLTALARMAELGRMVADALGRGDLDAVGMLIDEHWQQQRTLHPAITTPRIDAIFERARAAGALGGKALGASGGGCVAVFTRDDPGPVRAAVGDLGDEMSYALCDQGAAITDDRA